jgi:hypothetical protein
MKVIMAGRPVIWTKRRISCIADLMDRFIANDIFFEDSTFQDVAEAVPTIAHFIATIQRKWGDVQKEYEPLQSVPRPPSKATLLKIEELSDRFETINVIQERGLLYGALTGQLVGNVASLMLQNHGYIKRNANEITGSGGAPIEVNVVWGKSEN